MFSDYNELSGYPSFSITNGMIIQEAMKEKNIGFIELFPILGPKAVVMEIIYGKRALKPLQIKQLSELFNMNQEVFHIENSSIVSQESSFGDESQKIENFSGYPEEAMNSVSEEGQFGEMQNNSIEDESNEENSLNTDPDSNNEMKPFWED
jgi:hypothetical protein